MDATGAISGLTVIAVLKDLSGLAATVIIPLVLAYSTNKFTASLKEKESRTRFVELALEQLKAQPSAERASVRAWALQVVDKYSGVPLSRDAVEDLKTRVAFVSDSFNSSAPDVERAVVMRHSYGRQIGRLMDAVQALIDAAPGMHRDPRIRDLTNLALEISAIKRNASRDRLDTLKHELSHDWSQMRSDDGQDSR